jgi:iron-sulfur cluster repair protein YtfE (RIC family)
MQQLQPSPCPSVRKTFLEDHRRLEALMNHVLEASAGDDREELAGLWDQFDAQLLAHMEAEEAHLIPVLQLTSERDARALTQEHKLIRERLAELGVAVDLHAVRLTMVKQFIDELQAHAAHEDALLYARSDAAFAVDTRRTAIKALLDLVRPRRS